MAEIVRAGHHLGRRGPVRRGAVARHDAPADDAPDRAAAGDARDHPADGQRDDLDAQDVLAGERDRRRRAALRGAADLLGELQDDPAADRGEHLVPRLHERAVRRPVLPRALLRARRRPASGQRRRCSGCAPGCCRSDSRGEPDERRHRIPPPMVLAEGVHKRFGRNEVLRGIDLEVAAGRGACACSARPARASRRSCAASTTSRRSTRGACRSTASSSATARSATSCTSCASRRSPRKRSEIGMVFQHFNLFGHMTALENVTCAPICVKRERARARAGAGARAARPRRARRQASTPIPPSCPAASSSAWRSPARWRWSRS